TDPVVALEMAETALYLALEVPNKALESPRDYGGRQGRMRTRHYYDEARRLAGEAERLGAKGWRVEAVATLAAYYGGDLDAAYARAPTAAKAIPAGDGSWASMAVLT